MTAILFIITGAVLLYFVRQNRELAKQIKSLADRQEEAESKLDRLSRKSRKQTNTARKQEAKIERLHRKQREQADRQNRIEKEQKKQAEAIRKAEHKLSLALADIQSQETRLSQLFAVMDCLKNQQLGVVPGSASDVRLQRQIIVVENQVNAAERRIAQARYNEREARERIAA